MINDKLLIIRNTFGDRSVFLKLSLEYQNDIKNSSNYDTWLFLDPKQDGTISKEYNSIFFNQYVKYVFENHKGRKSWYLATKYIFDNYNYDYVLSIEDDVILSHDYINICLQIIRDKILEKDNILYLHPGAWEKPKGDPNKIVGSQISSRSILIHKSKFDIIKAHIESKNSFELSKTGNDVALSEIMKSYNMKTVAPEYNRHAHFGVYGWSSNGIHADMRGRSSVFDKDITDNELYVLMKNSLFSKDKLLKLNNNKNPQYFWNFDPKINFTTLSYNI